MRTSTALRLADHGVRTVGQGTGREVLINPHINICLLTGGWPTTQALLEAIENFEAMLYVAVKGLLKARRGDIVGERAEEAHADQPYYFTGHWTPGKDVGHGERRWAFTIADTNVLRAAAGLSGGGTRSADYVTYPNTKFLELGSDQQQALIDRALGPDWRSLQAAIKPSAHDYGVVLPDLRAMLMNAGNARAFLKQVLNEARPQNISGEVASNSPRFLMWCFLAHLRRSGYILLPLRVYYVHLFSSPRARFFDHVVFTQAQIDALRHLWTATKDYQEHSRLRMLRFVQTVMLSSSVDEIGDISPEAFTTLADNLMAGIGASPTYSDKFVILSRSAYEYLVRAWNEGNPGQAMVEAVGVRFERIHNPSKSVREVRTDRRRKDPFWFAEVPDDEWHRGHPISGYRPNPIVQGWAAILREAFPHIKVKNPQRFRVAGLQWLDFINGLDDPPRRIEEIVRNRHINDLISRSAGTFRRRLADLPLSPKVKNDVLSSLAQMFDIYQRIHGIEARNPIEFDLDRFLIPQPRGKTPRTPLSPEMLLYLKEFNRRDDFAFSRSLKPLSWTSTKTVQLRHYRRVVDPEDGEMKLLWWPGLAVLLDLMLTIPLRGFQARWLDTGEGDEFTLELDTLQDIPNPLPTARRGRQMGVFTSFPKGLQTPERLLGLRITTNKRAVECDGRYGIPWCPDDLRDSLAMLMAWQRRYNPIVEPVRAEQDRWVTFLRSEEVTALIPEVFALFRDPGSAEGFPPTYQQVQTYWNLLCVAAEDELHTTQGTQFRLTRDRNRRNGDTEYSERVALFDLHSLRVSGITALIEAGLPPHFVQEIVGHAAIVMTLYYHKIHPGQVNRALTDAFESRELSLERIPEVLADLDAYDAFLLNSRATEDALGRDMLRSAVGNGTYQVLSHGICPGGDCRTGGEYMQNEKEHQPVPRAGACALCRYRLTGPMFLVGLVVNANKIMAELHSKGQEIARLNDEVRLRRREGKALTSFEARREVLHRELEDLWMEWAAEHRYVQDSARLLTDYLRHRSGSASLPVLAAEGAIGLIAVKAERRHPFHLNQLLAEASAYVPSERHGQAIGERDAFLNELLANNDIDPFLLRLPVNARLEAGNMLGGLLAAMVPDGDLQALHDGLLPAAAFDGLTDGIRAIACGRKSAAPIDIVAAPPASLPESTE